MPFISISTLFLISFMYHNVLFILVKHVSNITFSKVLKLFCCSGFHHGLISRAFCIKGGQPLGPPLYTFRCVASPLHFRIKVIGSSRSHNSWEWSHQYISLLFSWIIEKSHFYIWTSTNNDNQQTRKPSFLLIEEFYSHTSGQGSKAFN